MYVHVVRVSCVCFLRILRKLYVKIIVYSRYPGKLMFAGVCVFNVSTRITSSVGNLPKEAPCANMVGSSLPGPSFSFNRDGEKLGLVHTVCACAELRATRGVRLWCDLPIFQGGSRIGWNTVFSSQNIRRGGKDVLEAVFAVKVEAGD